MANKIVVEYGYRSNAELVSFLLRLNSSEISIKWSDTENNRQIIISWEKNDVETRREVNEILDEISKIFKQPKITLEMDEERDYFKADDTKSAQPMSDSKEEPETFDVATSTNDDTVIVIDVSSETPVINTEESMCETQAPNDAQMTQKTKPEDVLGEAKVKIDEVQSATFVSHGTEAKEPRAQMVEEPKVQTVEETPKLQIVVEEAPKPSLEETKEALENLLEGIDEYDFVNARQKSLEKFCFDYGVTNATLRYVILYYSEYGSFDNIIKKIASGKNKALLQVSLQKSFQKWMGEEFPEFASNYPNISVKMFLETFRSIHLNS